MTSTLRTALLLGARLLEDRLAQLAARIVAGDEDAWAGYLVTVEAAAKLDRQLTMIPGSRGELITTKQMAERLGIAPKTLIRRKSQGEITPAQQAGRLIRWKGTEVVTPRSTSMPAKRSKAARRPAPRASGANR